MRCPRCDRPGYHPAEPCPGCQFGGDPALIEELAHVRWLLGQTSGWAEIGVGRASQEQIRLYYAARQRDLEIALGLRLPPFTDQEALRAWPELVWYETLRHKLSEWLAAGLLDPARVQAIAERAAARSSELHERLAGRPRPDDLAGDAGRLEVIRLALQTVTELRQDRCFTSAQAEEQALAPLLAEQARLEVRLGLRPAPEPKAGPAVEREAAPGGDVREAGGQADRALLPSLAPAPPAVPFRERLWRSLASERTLRSILFLGIFLLFAAAVSFVIWGWRDFTPLLRVSIPTGFTALFFVLGWYVRARMSLYRSGIALSATALLLIPIDFYTAYVNLHVPPESWPEFWLITSLACLGAYALVTWIIQSPVFGYLVGTAAGSVVLAAIEVGHKSAGLSRDWYSAGLTVLAVGMLLLGTAISRQARPGRWRVFADPFRYLALLAVGVLMPLTLAWRFIDRQGYDALHYALTINWWLGGFVLGWGAIHHRSRTLGLLAAMALPVAVYLAQAALFDRTGVNAAWHAVGWACLVPLYLGVGHTLSTRDDDPVIRGHGHTATGWGVAVLVVAALWSLTDLTSGAAAASSHAILSGAVALAAFLWRRPKGLYAASLLALSAATFAMAELGLTVPQLSVGWASLAIAHLVLALNLGDRPSGQAFAPPLALAGYVVAALALVPPLFPYDGHLLAYALANWIGLAAWGAHLAHTGRAGFKAQEAGEGGVDAGKVQIPGAAVLLQWLAALPLPLWLWILFTNRRPLDFGLPLALAALAWGMIALGHRLARVDASYLLPWRLAGLLVSVAAPIAARVLLPHGFTLATCLLSAGLLYFADAISRQQAISRRHAIGGQQAIEMAPAAGATAWGMMLFLGRLGVSFDVASLSLGLLVALYLAAGLWTERQRSRVFTHQFLAPLYLAAHALTLIVLWRVYSRLFDRVFLDAPWTDEMRLWGALAQLVLGIVYGLYAWGRYEERWGHAAAWLGTASGGFLLTIYSHGRGSSAAKAALMAISFVLAERGLCWLWQRREIVRRRRALARLAWHLYRRPLLVAGWVVSAGVIGLALIRNLWLLGGGRVQQTWAAAGLLLITGLYALAARVFRRARFVWLAAALVLAPWTILSNLGWYTHLRPTVPGFGISWAVLAWTLFLAGLLVGRLAPRAYALPLRVMAHVLLPFSLLWGVADAETSRFTFGLAIGLYLVAAWLDARRYRRGDGGGSLLAATRFRYPAWGLVPVWCVYWVAWSLPAARHEHYGLLLLAFALLELAAGRWLPSWGPFRLQGRSSTGPGEPLEGLAGYLAAYASLVFGTMLVAHVAPLLALALLYGAALMLVSARLFRNPLWAYPAVAAVLVALLIALSEAGVPGNRHGWWLIGLAAVYLALAWLLRRVRLHAYATSVLAAGFALVALGLPPSSEDQTGALWGYGAAALLYALTALWLRQPLLLTPACALSIVPYAIGLQRSSLAPDYYGLALFPGATIALALGWASDARTGGWQHFPWGRPSRWPAALAERLLSWWGLPLYALGFGLAAASPFFTRSRADLAALNWALLVPLSGWAVYRFRLRGWLLALGIAGHLSVLFQLKALGWWAYPARAVLWFMPVTALTTFTGLFIERHGREGTPLDLRRTLHGWSRPLYLLAAADVLLGQAYSLDTTTAGALVTLAHALLAAVLVWAWRSSVLAYASAALGAAALGQWLAAWEWPTMDLPVAFARLALGYGAAGYGLALWRLVRAEAVAGGTPGTPDAPARWPGTLLSAAARKRGGEPGLRPWLAAWERPLQRSAMILSLGVLALAGWLGVDLAGWTVRALLGLPFRAIVDLATVRMAVGVLSWLGLLYVAASVVHRRLRLGYAAVGMLLAGWMLYAFYVWQLDGLARVQWYAIPAGLYLLGIAYLECQRENRVLARWLDYAAVALMMGSLFWQTLSLGWRYALMLGGEGFGALWWGSARRLRRFFYAGMIGVILATLGQLINSLQSINQWVVFGIIGLLLVIVAAVVERRLEEIRSSLQEVMEDWE